jgi:hypothetical protein
MEDRFWNMLVAFILVGLFGMLMLTSVVEVGSRYSKDTSEIVGGSLSINKFNQSINSIEGNSKALKERFDKGSIWSALAGVVVEGVFGIAKDMITMMLYPFGIVSDIMNNMFGIPTYVTSVLLGILILGMIFGIWALIKIGN